MTRKMRCKNCGWMGLSSYKRCPNCGEFDTYGVYPKTFFVGVSYPYGQNKLMWDVSENVDALSPDLLARKGNIELPLLKIESNNEDDAVREYKKRVPSVRNWRLIRGWK